MGGFNSRQIFKKSEIEEQKRILNSSTFLHLTKNGTRLDRKSKFALLSQTSWESWEPSFPKFKALQSNNKNSFCGTIESSSVLTSKQLPFYCSKLIRKKELMSCILVYGSGVVCSTVWNKNTKVLLRAVEVDYLRNEGTGSLFPLIFILFHPILCTQI